MKSSIFPHFNPNRSLDCYALMTDLGLIWCPVNIMLKPSATLINRPLRPSGNVLASHWGVLPSRGHRSAFSASSSVQFAPNLGEESGCGLRCATSLQPPLSLAHILSVLRWGHAVFGLEAAAEVAW